MQPRMPRLHSDAVLQVLFDTLIHGDHGRSICEAALALDALCNSSSNSDAARDCLHIWARSYIRMNQWKLASYAVSDCPDETATLLSVLRLLKALVRASKSLDEQDEKLIALSTDQSFLRTLKTTMVSTVPNLATSSAMLVNELAQLDCMIAQQLLVCGSGIVDHIWDGVRTYTMGLEEASDDDICCLSAFLTALEGLATASPAAFFDGRCSIQQMIIMLTHIIGNSNKFESELQLAVACNSLNMAYRLSEYIGQTDDYLTNRFDTLSVVVKPIFKALRKRLLNCAPKFTSASYRMIATRTAEWRMLRSIIETVALLNAAMATVVDSENILDAMVQTLVLTAINTIPSMQCTDHNLLRCPKCALLKCITALYALLRDRHDNQSSNQRLLDALLMFLLPKYLEPTSCKIATDQSGFRHLHCASLYAEVLTTAFQYSKDSRHLREAIFQAGGPYCLLMSMTAINAVTTVNQPSDLTVLWPIIACYMKLYGHDIVIDLVCEDTMEDWCFVFMWFALELKAFRQQQGRHAVMSSDEAMKSLVHVSSEILTDFPNQRLSFAWPATRRKLAAIFLVQTCATLELAPSGLKIELLSYTTAALDSLLRASTFSALLDSGVLSDAPGIFLLLHLIAAASHHVRSRVQLPASLSGLIENYFKSYDTTKGGNPVAPSALAIIVSLPGDVIGSTLTTGLIHASESDLCDLICRDFKMSLQLLTVLSNLENKSMPRQAMTLVCRALSKSILFGQPKSVLSSDESTKILEVLLRRMLSTSREVSSKCHDSSQDRNLIFQEIYELTRAFAMTLLQAHVSRTAGTSLLRVVALLFDSLWRDPKQLSRDGRNHEVLLWSINAANASLSHTSGNDRLTALKILGPYLDTFLALLKSRVPGDESCRVASLISVVFVALASGSAASVTSRNSTSWFCGIRNDNIAMVLKKVVSTMSARQRLSCKDDAERVIACWALAALLRTPAASEKSIPGDLRDLIRLRTKEILMMPLGIRGLNAIEGACRALIQLIALESTIANRQQTSALSSWCTFTGRWLLHQSLNLSPYVALCIAALLNDSAEIDDDELREHCASVNIVNQLQESIEMSDAGNSTSALLHLVATACNGRTEPALKIASAALEPMTSGPMQRFLESKRSQQREDTPQPAMLTVYDDIFLPSSLESLLSNAASLEETPVSSSTVVTDPELVDWCRCEEAIMAAGTAANVILSI